MRDDIDVRTTLNIDDDVLLAAKSIADRQGVTAGHVLSELARQALKPGQPSVMRNGVPLFPVREGAKVVTMELVNRLRDELP